MTDDRKPANESVVPLQKLVRCRRTGRDFDLCEHQKCPYCFGTAEEIATRRYEKFCDFKPGVDPVCYGFPGDTSRDLHG